jgi:hypothetical protein
MSTDIQFQTANMMMSVSSAQQSSACLSLEYKDGGNPTVRNSELNWLRVNESVKVFAFIAHDERDLFYDALLCVMCHTEPLFKESFLKDISPEDVSGSRFLKSKVVKNLSGEYVFVTFNRRNLLKQQSSISALQSAGFFSSNEPSLKDMLNMGTNKSSIGTSQSAPFADSVNSTPTKSSKSQEAAHKTQSNAVTDTSISDNFKAEELLEDLIDMHTVYSTQDKHRRSLFSSTSDNHSFRNSFSFQNPSTSSGSTVDASLTTVVTSSQPKKKNDVTTAQRRLSMGEDNVVRMAAFYTNRKSGPTYEGVLQRQSNSSTQGDNSIGGKKPVKIDLDAPRRNRVSQRRGSASSVLAQQTAKFIQKAASKDAITTS